MTVSRNCKKTSRERLFPLTDGVKGYFLLALGFTCYITQRSCDGIRAKNSQHKARFLIGVPSHSICCCSCWSCLLPVQSLLTAYFLLAVRKLCISLLNTDKTYNWFEKWLLSVFSIYVDFPTFRVMDEYNDANEGEKERFLLKHHYQGLLVNLL